MAVCPLEPLPSERLKQAAMGACFGKKGLDCEAAMVVPSCHPAYRFGGGAVLRLFGRELCPLTARIRIALQHKGVPVDAIWVPADGAGRLSSAKLEWLASVLPLDSCSFPVLQHGGSLVHGSADDIVEYVEATFTEPQLWAPPPESSASVMDVRDWVAYIRDTVTPLLCQALYEGEVQAQEEVEAAYARLDRGLWEHSKGGAYFFGHTFTMADVYLVPTLELVRPLAYFRGVELREVHTHLVAYAKRMVHFPAYAPVRMEPDLLDMAVSKALEERAPPALSSLILLQHRSISTHLADLVSAASALASTKVDAAAPSPVKANLGLKLKGISQRYACLLELMQEHAQMEERVIFPVLDHADKGLTVQAQSDHARDLPIMNGIREDMKSVVSLQQGSSIHCEALVALATRLSVFQDCTREHFLEEERDILPLLEDIGCGRKQQQAAVESCLLVMEQSHGRLLPYLLQGLAPHDIYHYVSILHRAAPVRARNIVASLQTAATAGNNDASAAVWKVMHQRLPALTAAAEA